MAQTNLVPLPGEDLCSGKSLAAEPPAASSSNICRAATPSPPLVLLERAEFGTRPAIKLGCKFDAGGVEERPSQMIDIHGADHQGPDDVGQSATNVSCG